MNNSNEWELIFKSVSDLIMVLSLDQEIIAVNPAMEKATGKTENELIGKHCYTVFHCTDHLHEECPHKKLVRSAQLETMEMEMEALGGHYMVTVAPIFNAQGELIRTVHISKDITEWKKTENRLQESSEILDNIFSIPHYLIVLLDKDFNFIRVNSAYAATGNHAPDFFVGKNHFDLYPHEENEAIFKDVVKTGKPFTVFAKPFEFPDQPERGTTYWDWSLYPIKDHAGEAEALLFTLIDVTERQKAEIKIVESEKKHRRLIENISREYFLYSHDTEGIFTYVSPSITDILGYTQQEFLTRIGQYLTDNPANHKVVEHTRLSIKGQKQPPYVLEIYHKDGSIYHFEVIETPVFDNNGNVVAVEGIAHDISGRIKADAKLREQEAQWSQAMDFIDDAIYLIDLDDKVKAANKAFYDLTGLTPDQVIGQDATSIIHPQGETMPCQVCAARKERRDAVIRMEAGHPDNPTPRPIQVMVNIIRDEAGDPLHILMGIRDMSPEERLRESEERFRNLAENISDWIWEVDENGVYTYTSPKVEDLLGYSPAEVLGKSLFDLMERGEAERVGKAFAEIVRKKASFSHLRNVNIHRDGRAVTIESSGVPICNSQGELRGYRGIDRDISERIRIESRLQQAQKMEAIGTLAGGIAHDFNNILSPIIGYTELVMDLLPPDGEEVSLLHEVKRASFRAKDLVKQILAFSRKGDKEKEPLKIQPIIKEALKLLRSSIPTSIDIRQDIDESCGPVLCDSTQIHRVIINLCTNAYHAMMNEQGTIEVSVKSIAINEEESKQIDMLPAGQYVRMVISDTGHGMDKATMAKIFEPYFTTKKLGEGTGLGLSVVHGIVEDHNGRITVYSEKGKGTTFTVYIPEIMIRQKDAETETVEILPSGNERILLVDDELSIATMLARRLKRLGYSVTAETDSIKALDCFRQTPEQFDLVITDQTMPHIAGCELAKRMLEIRPDIPIILCTGYSSVISKKESEAIGIRHFLLKPVMASELAKTIRAVLEDR